MSVPEIPVGDWIDSAVNWLQDNLAWLFDIISTVLSFLVDNLHDGLKSVPSIALAVGLAVLALWVSRPTVALFTLLGFLLIDSMGMWGPAMTTLAQVLVASVVAVVIAVPIGIAAARSDAVSRIVKPMLDFMQTMPVFVYLIPAIFFFSVGAVPGVVATIVFGMPPGIRLTELGIRQVDKEIVEAGEAFGAPPRRILSGIQLPLALPTIMAGVNQVIMLSLSMVVVAGMVGAGGLGAEVFRGITRLNVGLGFEGGLAVVILAIFLDRMTASFTSRRRRGLSFARLPIWRRRASAI